MIFSNNARLIVVACLIGLLLVAGRVMTLATRRRSASRASEAARAFEAGNDMAEPENSGDLPYRESFRQAQVRRELAEQQLAILEQCTLRTTCLLSNEQARVFQVGRNLARDCGFHLFARVSLTAIITPIEDCSAWQEIRSAIDGKCVDLLLCDRNAFPKLAIEHDVCRRPNGGRSHDALTVRALELAGIALLKTNDTMPDAALAGAIFEALDQLQRRAGAGAPHRQTFLTSQGHRRCIGF